MRKRSSGRNQSLPCTGYKLPKEFNSISCSESATCLNDCCLLLQIEDDVILYEKLERAYYWVILEADEIQLVACHLEEYANLAAKNNNWQGRRADYLLAGWYEGNCYLVFTEIRHIINNDQQAEDKLQQLEESIDQVMGSFKREIDNSSLFIEACDQPDQYRVIGVVIAPAGIRSITREKYKRIN